MASVTAPRPPSSVQARGRTIQKQHWTPPYPPPPRPAIFQLETATPATGTGGPEPAASALADTRRERNLTETRDFYARGFRVAMEPVWGEHLHLGLFERPDDPLRDAQERAVRAMADDLPSRPPPGFSRSPAASALRPGIWPDVTAAGCSPAIYPSAS